MSFVSILVVLMRWLLMAAERPNRLRISWDIVIFYEYKPACCNRLHNALYQPVSLES
jgi:hypothetical protein